MKIGGDLDRAGSVAVNADAVDRRRQDFSAGRDELAGVEHGGDMGAARLGIMQHRAGFSARRQRTVVLIGAVGEDFERDPQPRCRAGFGRAANGPAPAE